MNNTRRKQLQKAIELISDAYSIIEEVRQDEQESFDNLPDGIQESERGQLMEENAYRLDEIYSYLQDQEIELEDIING